MHEKDIDTVGAHFGMDRAYSVEFVGRTWMHSYYYDRTDGKVIYQEGPSKKLAPSNYLVLRFNIHKI